METAHSQQVDLDAQQVGQETDYLLATHVYLSCHVSVSAMGPFFICYQMNIVAYLTEGQFLAGNGPVSNIRLYVTYIFWSLCANCCVIPAFWTSPTGWLYL